MASNLVKSAKGMSNLCHILNRHCKTHETQTGFVKETDIGICPHCGKKMAKHIISDGARYHVHSYHGYTDNTRDPVKCSNPDCEDNHGIGRCVGRNGNP